MNQTKIPNVEKEKEEVINVQVIQIILNLTTIHSLAGILLVICMVSDVKTHKIPNGCIVLFLLLAAGAMVNQGNIAKGIERFLGMLVLLAVFYPLFCVRMIGAGDVKLLAVLALYMSADKVLYFLFLSCFLAGCGALCKMLFNQSIRRRFAYLRDYFRGSVKEGKFRAYYEKRQGSGDTIPMAVPIGISFFLYLGGMY